MDRSGDDEVSGAKNKGALKGFVLHFLKVAMGRRTQLSVFGSDWDTEDGTGISCSFLSSFNSTSQQ